MCFSRRDASTYMQHDLSGSPRDLGLGRTLTLTLIQVDMHIFRRVSTKGTRRRLNYSTSKTPFER